MRLAAAEQSATPVNLRSIVQCKPFPTVRSRTPKKLVCLVKIASGMPVVRRLLLWTACLV